MKKPYPGITWTLHRFDFSDIVCSSIPTIETYSSNPPSGQAPVVRFEDVQLKQSN